MQSAPPPAYRDPDRPVSERVSDLLARMTLEEKAAQLSGAWLFELADEAFYDPNLGFSMEKARARIGGGIGQITGPASRSPLAAGRNAERINRVQEFLARETRLGIPALVHDECCCGFMARDATVFPQAIGLASTWDPELVEAAAAVMRAQMRAQGVHQGLAPVLDVNRDPRWGRIEETYGEDPYLAARTGVAYVRGLQGPDWRTGVIATAKHYATYGNSEGGLNWAPAHVGARELREVFLFPFEAAVREAGIGSVMNAYSEIDGVPCGASRELLSDILRGEWGFEGFVASDYNTVAMLADYHHLAENKRQAAKLALEAGLDVELPGTDCYGEPLLAALRAGEIDPAVLDRAVGRVLTLKFRLGLFEQPYVDPRRAGTVYDRPEQAALARRLAQESIVLLKNDGGVLPLGPDIRSIAVIGPNADAPRHMLGDYTYGAFTDLLGATPEEVQARFPQRLRPMLSIRQAIEREAGPGVRVRYAQGCDYKDPSTEGFAAAVEAARASQAAVLVVGGKSGLTGDCTCGELRDRATLGLLGVQEELVAAVLATGTPTILVIVDGRPAAIPELARRIPAILQAWLPGEEGGPALADLLFGRVSPSGRLPVSVPRSVGQVPVYYGHKPSGGTSYNFGDYVDESAKPLFPFGHGLSYTTFEYSDLEISPPQTAPAGGVSIAATVKNRGQRAGDEVVQLYLRDEAASVTRPVQELKGFQRIALQPGEARRVTFALSAAQMAFYNLRMEYVVEPGKIGVLLGSSAEDIRLRGEFEIVGETTVVRRKVFFSGCETHLPEG